MDTPPRWSARRVVSVQAARMLRPPPEACDREGVFSAVRPPFHHASTTGMTKPQAHLPRTFNRFCLHPFLLPLPHQCL